MPEPLSSAPMQIEQARPEEAATVAAVLSEAAQWIAAEGRPLWTATDIAPERIRRDTEAGGYFIARNGGEVAGVVRLDLEDPHFWPEIESGSSVFVHKLAVRRAWAGQGVPAALLGFAREHARGLGRPWPTGRRFAGCTKASGSLCTARSASRVALSRAMSCRSAASTRRRAPPPAAARPTRAAPSPNGH